MFFCFFSSLAIVIAAGARRCVAARGAGGMIAATFDASRGEGWVTYGTSMKVAAVTYNRVSDVKTRCIEDELLLPIPVRLRAAKAERKSCQ